jgi:hypothetical protein
VKTELYQLAELVRGGRLLIMAPTWPRGTRIHEAEMTAVINLHHLRGTAQKEIERQIRIFVEDLVRSNHPAMTGTVRYIEIPGGGSFGIVADNGVNYDPHNLPREFAVDGLRVMFRAIEEHARCPHRWGRTVRIIWIERLRPMPGFSAPQSAADRTCRLSLTYLSQLPKVPHRLNDYLPGFN